MLPFIISISTAGRNAIIESLSEMLYATFVIKAEKNSNNVKMVAPISGECKNCVKNSDM